ncbi:MAG: tRNA (adenosine(37)-N6)-threonylcarbamoyltransferase complex transferase subunit TsaD, partial [bacterium]
MIILAIETSCDETSAAVIRDGGEILSNIISTQVEFHKKYGGIVPEIASRKHIEVINPIIQEALDKAKVTFKNIDAVAVTHGPGLVGSLLVGLCAAKAIAYSLNIPLIGVNHLEGHIYANFLFAQPKFPFMCLMVSGGHTMLVLVEGHSKYKVIGRTRDDAAGEAFDKVARFLKLGYPGGPIIDKLAKEGNPEAVKFTRPMLEDGFDFSFSGIKTAVVNYVNQL